MDHTAAMVTSIPPVRGKLKLSCFSTNPHVSLIVHLDHAEHMMVMGQGDNATVGLGANCERFHFLLYKKLRFLSLNGIFV
jgi:hypothetical protein